MSSSRGSIARAALGFLLAGALVGCDSRGSASPSHDGPPRGDAAAGDGAAAIASSDLPAAIGAAICERRWACCSMAERDRAGFAPDQRTCADRLAIAFNLLLPEIQRSVATGRAAYDGAALARCLSAMGGLSCEIARAGVPLSISLTGCPYLIAQLPLGAACGQGFECVGGYCAGVRVNGDGSCVPKKSNGSPCLTLDECTSNWCDLDTEACAPEVPRPLCQPPD